MIDIKERLQSRLEDIWYGSDTPPLVLVAIARLFQVVVTLRQWAYANGVKKSFSLPVPVIVVGNLTVGGTGKTPLTIWLAKFLSESGYKPGIVSRGYGGDTKRQARQVGLDSDYRIVGDEALVIVRQTKCPMAVGANRVEAIKLLLDKQHCDVIISDDGLQHYAMSRDIEIVVVDSARRFGNGYCLPAGPMREPAVRLNRVDLVVYSGVSDREGFSMKIRNGKAVNLRDASLTKDVTEFSPGKVHIVAGIGNPQRFFEQFEETDLYFDRRCFPDHYSYKQQDLEYGDDLPVLMTEKDAVKCGKWASENHWYIPIQAEIDTEFGDMILQLLAERSDGRKVT